MRSGGNFRSTVGSGGFSTGLHSSKGDIGCRPADYRALKGSPVSISERVSGFFASLWMFALVMSVILGPFVLLGWILGAIFGA